MLQSRFIAHRPTFSSVDEHIAQVILTMPYDPDLTSTSLAKRCDVSQSTIVRFAQKLGYASFREFLSDYVSFKHHQEGIIHLSESTTSLQRMKESLNYIEAYAQSSVYQDVFEQLTQTQRRVIVCHPSLSSLAQLIQAHFNELNCACVIKSSLDLNSFHDLNENDVLVILESNQSEVSLECVMLSKHSGAKSVLITQKDNSPLHQYVEFKVQVMPSQDKSMFALAEYVHGCMHVITLWMEVVQTKHPSLLQQRESYKQRLSAIQSLVKHKSSE